MAFVKPNYPIHTMKMIKRPGPGIVLGFRGKRKQMKVEDAMDPIEAEIDKMLREGDEEGADERNALAGPKPFRRTRPEDEEDVMGPDARKKAGRGGEGAKARAYRGSTVGDLRAMLDGFDDDTPVVVAYPSHDYWKTTIALSPMDAQEGFIKWSGYHEKFEVIDEPDEGDLESPIQAIIIQ